MTQLETATEHVRKVRAAIDMADDTPFGDLGKLLDQMAVECDRAIKAIELAKERGI